MTAQPNPSEFALDTFLRQQEHKVCCDSSSAARSIMANPR